MLQPKKTKFRKAQKGRMKGLSQRGHQLSNGMFGIKALDSVFITSRQIEAARIAATRYMKEKGSFGLKFFQISPLPKSPLKYVWGKVKELQNILLQLPKQVELCLKWQVCLTALPKKHFGSLPKNFQ